MTPETIRDVILALRLAKGWSQTELAKRAGLSRNAIALIETNAKRGQNPRISTLLAIFNALGVDIEIHITRKKK